MSGDESVIRLPCRALLTAPPSRDEAWPSRWERLSCGHGGAFGTMLPWKSDSIFKHWHGTPPDGHASN